MSNRDFLFWLADELGKFLHPLEVSLSSEEAFSAFLERYGWLSDPNSFDISDVRDVFDIIVDLTTAASLSREILTPADVATSLETFIELVDVFRGIAGKIRVLSALPVPAGFSAEMWGTFTRELIDGLLAEYLEMYRPLSFALLILLVVVEEEFVDVNGAQGRTAYTRRSINWQRLKGIIQPGELGREVYGWDDPVKLFEFEFFLDRFKRFFDLIGLPAELELPRQALIDIYYDPSSPHLPQVKELRVMLMGGQDENLNSFDYSLLILPIPPDGQPAAPPDGLVISPSITSSGAFPLLLIWPYSLEFSGFFQSEGSVRLEIQPDTVTTVLDVPGETKVDADLALVFESISPMIIAGTWFSHRLQLFGWKVGLRVFGPLDDLELALELSFNRLQLVVDFSDADGFLKEEFGGGVQTLDAEVALVWSSKTGFHFRGQSALELIFLIHRTLSIVEVISLTLSLRAQGDNLEFITGLTGKVKLNPILVSIDNVGVRLLLEPVEEDEPAGVFGNLDVDFDFKPPDGIGLSIDGGGFQGGGFLRYIEAEQRYEGMLELEYQDRITLKAIGLLTTRMPDGSSGFSLLIIIIAEFTPIQLGLGFTLNGVGGLLGLNRTANVERLRTGLRDKTLNSVLFPQNVIANASRILSDLTQIFPPQADRFIFGPMARIGWGTPTLITIDLGLLIEIPDPVRVLILGVVRALLPDEEKRLLQLQVNFLGVIDFEAQHFSFDASLFDSKLLGYTLSGDMAVRLSWGAEPNFLLTVGGFHPAYEPPPLNLPTLRRLSLQLLGGNPRLSLETYFAVTSNTVQFGAKVELYAAAGSFNVYGFLSFDVLFQFNPFYFIASISAKIALRAGSSEIASISLDFSLKGPTPWHAKGTAKLKICWFLTIKVRFDKTFGEERNTRLDDISVLPLLQAALSDKGNWEARLPSNRHMLVSFNQIQTIGDQVVVYPFGILTIQQKVVPLQIEVQKLGSQRPADGNHFAIEQVLAGEEGDMEALTTSDVRELFAPAQFFELSDAQKLSSKSFERYDSGVKLVDSEAFNGDYAIRRVVAYELFYIDEQRTLLHQPEPHLPDFLAFDRWALSGAIANSPLSHARNGKSALAPETVQVGQEAYAVVNASDLRLAEASTLAASEAGAHHLMEGLIRSNPALEGEILVVPAFEVNRS